MKILRKIIDCESLEISQESVLLKNITFNKTFNFKGGLYSVKDNIYIRMPMLMKMPMPMPMPTCRYRDFQMAFSEQLSYKTVSNNVIK